MAKDFLLDETGDLQIANGDFVIGESTKQEIQLLLTTKKGEWKQNPLVGGNLQQFLKQRDGQTAALREINIQLKNDGLTVNKVNIEADNLTIDAERL